MIELLLLLLLNACYILGFYLAMQPGMIGGSVGTWLGIALGKWYNPIAGCVTCMASLHSWPYLAAFGLDWLYIVYLFALAGVSTLIFNIYEG